MIPTTLQAGQPHTRLTKKKYSFFEKAKWEDHSITPPSATKRSNAQSTKDHAPTRHFHAPSTSRKTTHNTNVHPPTTLQATTGPNRNLDGINPVSIHLNRNLDGIKSMGGGGAMRAAVKAAGVGLQNAGIRGLPENFATRKAVRPPASVLSSAVAADDSRKLEISASSKPAAAIAWELDDWELAGYDLEEKPRLVFGPAPSLEESKEAASELSDALDLLYFNPSKSAGSFHSASAVDEPSVVSECESENSVVSSVPNHAFQAFKLFKENSSAQNVVAAIASDPNVWNAVLENDALKKFLQSETKCKEVVEQVEPLNSSADSSVEADAEISRSLFADFAENVKIAVAGWVDNMSAFFQEMFGDADVKTSTGPANWSPSSNTVCGSLFALASMVIMVVVLKRA